MLNKYLKKRAIKKYIYMMSPELSKRYGALPEYTVFQLEATTKSCGLSEKYIPYAIALFRENESENTLKRYQIDQSFLEVLRKEISQWFFAGYSYTTKDIMSLAKPKGWRGGYNTDALSNVYGQNSRY
ncbi:DUF6559 family protein [Endozoicomonas elysicola]|nr:DUF6559 family protein [Endozoicomonas elysicola]